MPPDKDGIGSRAASADPVDVASQLNQLEQAISAMRAQLSQIMAFVEQQPKKQLTVNEAAKLGEAGVVELFGTEDLFPPLTMNSAGSASAGISSKPALSRCRTSSIWWIAATAEERSRVLSDFLYSRLSYVNRATKLSPFRER